MTDPIYPDARTGSSGKQITGTPGNVLAIAPSGVGVQPVPPGGGSLPLVLSLGASLVAPAVPSSIELTQHHLYTVTVFLDIELPPEATGTFEIDSPNGVLLSVDFADGSRTYSAVASVWASVTDGENLLSFALNAVADETGYLANGWVTLLDLGLQE